MAQDSSNFYQVTLIKENSNLESQMDSAYSIGRMEKDMRENSKMEKNMVKECGQDMDNQVPMNVI